MHELSGLGSDDNHGPLYRTPSSYGVYPRVDFLKIHEVFRSYFPDFEITVPVGRENFKNALCDQFPADKDSIIKMSGIIFEFATEYARGPTSCWMLPAGNAAPSRYGGLKEYISSLRN
ncbi:MAG: hypothetical protein ABSA18_13635 [Dehalococcoidia bacterium]